MTINIRNNKDFDTSNSSIFNFLNPDHQRESLNNLIDAEAASSSIPAKLKLSRSELAKRFESMRKTKTKRSKKLPKSQKKTLLLSISQPLPAHQFQGNKPRNPNFTNKIRSSKLISLKKMTLQNFRPTKPMQHGSDKPVQDGSDSDKPLLVTDAEEYDHEDHKEDRHSKPPPKRNSPNSQLAKTNVNQNQFQSDIPTNYRIRKAITNHRTDSELTNKNSEVESKDPDVVKVNTIYVREWDGESNTFNCNGNFTKVKCRPTYSRYFIKQPR